MDFHYQSSLKCIVILAFLIPLATATVSFNFNSFSPNNSDIIYEGTAQNVNNSIQLTANEHQSSARATYAQPLHLWDRASGNVTDFSTNISFVVDSHNMSRYGDGFTFFLAPNTSAFESNATGGSLGLTGLRWSSPNLHFVAVEFDLSSNEGVDPPYQHVGINLNAINSLSTMRWWSANSSIMSGRPQEASISYDFRTGNMSVVFAGFSNGSSVTRRLSQRVDLKRHLPEFVTFGFTASTGGSTAVQMINSWSFSSNSHMNENTAFPPTEMVTPPVASSPVAPNIVSSGNMEIGLMWLVIGGLALGFML